MLDFIPIVFFCLCEVIQFIFKLVIFFNFYREKELPFVVWYWLWLDIDHFFFFFRQFGSSAKFCTQTYHIKFVTSFSILWMPIYTYNSFCSNANCHSFVLYYIYFQVIKLLSELKSKVDQSKYHLKDKHLFISLILF